MPRRKTILIRVWVILEIAVPTIGLGACIGMIGDALNGSVLFAPWWGISKFAWWPWSGGLTIALVTAFLCAVWLYQKIPAELPLRSLSRPAKPEPHQVLIILMSTPVPACRLENDDLLFLGPAGNETHRTRLSGDLDQDIQTLNAAPRWNWQQQLRALALHCPRLERVYLIGSCGDKGSHHFHESFRDIVHRYGGDIPVLWQPEGVDFEDIEAVYRRALCHILQAETPDKSGACYPQEEIMIDATGGLKTASIAAGLVTLHNRVRFQYVNNAGHVVAYEMIYEPVRTFS